MRRQHSVYLKKCLCVGVFVCFSLYAYLSEDIFGGPDFKADHQRAVCGIRLGFRVKFGIGLGSV